MGASRRTSRFSRRSCRRSSPLERWARVRLRRRERRGRLRSRPDRDRKSTRLNSSHLGISYAVFCLKKKKKKHNNRCVQSKYKTQQKITEKRKEPKQIKPTETRTNCVSHSNYRRATYTLKKTAQ